MRLNHDFVFEPLPPIERGIHRPFPRRPHPLGPLNDLLGKWVGNRAGFNVIWRPSNISAIPPNTPGQDRFLELNITDESIRFDAISGPIPNRGLLQPDINMFGLTYLQQISDANLGAGLHIEPGIWAVVPETEDPLESPTVVRMASIPHGTAILAQGTATTTAGPPTIPNINILPFPIGNPAGTIPFPEQNLAAPTAFRSPAPQLVGVTQAMVDNPNSMLQAAIAGQTILSTTTLQISTTPTLPIVGGGVANTAFLDGNGNGPNAMTVDVTATFWIEVVEGTPNFLQLQYTQLVLLNFNTLSWPHVTVGTLRLHEAVSVAPTTIDPTFPPGNPLGPDPIEPSDPVRPIEPFPPIEPLEPAGSN